MITHTRTVARLELSPAAYDEVRTKLLEAGYDHQFIKEEVEMIDMHGIGLVRGEEPKVAMVQNDEIVRRMKDVRVNTNHACSCEDFPDYPCLRHPKADE